MFDKGFRLTALALLALLILSGCLQLPGGMKPRGGLRDGNSMGPEPDENMMLSRIKEDLGLPAEASRTEVLAALSLPEDADQRQVWEASRDALGIDRRNFNG